MSKLLLAVASFAVALGLSLHSAAAQQNRLPSASVLCSPAGFNVCLNRCVATANPIAACGGRCQAYCTAAMAKADASPHTPGLSHGLH